MSEHLKESLPNNPDAQKANDLEQGPTQPRLLPEYSDLISEDLLEESSSLDNMFGDSPNIDGLSNFYVDSSDLLFGSEVYSESPTGILVKNKIKSFPESPR